MSTLIIAFIYLHYLSLYLTLTLYKQYFPKKSVTLKSAIDVRLSKKSETLKPHIDTWVNQSKSNVIIFLIVTK